MSDFRMGTILGKGFAQAQVPTVNSTSGRNQSSITPAMPCVGNWDVPFVTCGEIIFPTTRGFATRGRKYPVPYPLPQGNGTLLFLQ